MKKFKIYLITSIVLFSGSGFGSVRSISDLVPKSLKGPDGLNRIVYNIRRRNFDFAYDFIKENFLSLVNAKKNPNELRVYFQKFISPLYDDYYTSDVASQLDRNTVVNLTLQLFTELERKDLISLIANGWLFDSVKFEYYNRSQNFSKLKAFTDFKDKMQTSGSIVGKNSEEDLMKSAYLLQLVFNSKLSELRASTESK
jgi:hypothetical protein